MLTTVMCIAQLIEFAVAIFAGYALGKYLYDKYLVECLQSVTTTWCGFAAFFQLLAIIAILINIDPSGVLSSTQILLILTLAKGITAALTTGISVKVFQRNESESWKRNM